MIVEAILSLMLIAGASFAFIGSLGLVKLPDFYMRLHGPTKATTLGIGLMLGASVLYAATARDTFTLHEVLITLFLFMTAPISAHLLSKTALHRGIEDSTGAVMENVISSQLEPDVSDRPDLDDFDDDDDSQPDIDAEPVEVPE